MNIFRKLAQKPWLQPNQFDDVSGETALDRPSARVGLWLFLAVVTSLFGLFLSAYSMRSEYPDWRSFAKPGLLWVNTAILILSSVGLQSARMASDQGRMDRVRLGLSAGALFALAFLAGQMLAWQQLIASGVYAATNPSSAFFYLLTAVHGLHLAGGFWVLTTVIIRAWGDLQDRDPREVSALRLSIELCTVYWHFLLLVWLVLFALLLST